MNKNIEIIQPDDWHVHFREGDMLEMVTNFSSRINKRCVAMPNTEIPITDTNKALLVSVIGISVFGIATHLLFILEEKLVTISNMSPSLKCTCQSSG